jgi:toxin ParE1/3/4
MRIRWAPSAAADLEHIFEYLQTHSPSLARSTVIKLYEGIRSLRALPHLGRPGRKEGTRELVFAPLPYVAVYRLKDQFIEVLRIYHGAQDRSN